MMICSTAIEAAHRILALAAEARGEEIVTADAIACALELVAVAKSFDAVSAGLADARHDIGRMCDDVRAIGEMVDGWGGR